MQRCKNKTEGGKSSKERESRRKAGRDEKRSLITINDIVHGKPKPSFGTFMGYFQTLSLGSHTSSELGFFSSGKLSSSSSSSLSPSPPGGPQKDNAR